MYIHTVRSSGLRVSDYQSLNEHQCMEEFKLIEAVGIGDVSDIHKILLADMNWLDVNRRKVRYQDVCGRRCDS